MSSQSLSGKFEEAASSLVGEAVHTILAYRGTSEDEIIETGVKADFPVTSQFLTIMANQLAGGLVLDSDHAEGESVADEIDRRGSEGMKRLLIDALRQNEFINPQF